jgi:1-acyl-sn-glycerol-3-phosphate acyltransferase
MHELSGKNDRLPQPFDVMNRPPSDLPTRSEGLCRWFTWYAQRHMRRHFHAVRVSRQGRPPSEWPPGPLLFVTNHPSWWDPLFGLVLAQQFTKRRLYAPIDAESLVKFPFMRKLGLFGIETKSLRGAKAFLQNALAVLNHPDAVLAVTVQGEFTDVRKRPVVLRSGVGHVGARLTHGHIFPLAFEYVFWNERLPEALAYFGEPIPIIPGRTATEWTERLAAALEQTQDRLAQESLQRDASLFDTLFGGRGGTGGVYDVWRRIRAWLSGRSTTHDAP